MTRGFEQGSKTLHLNHSLSWMKRNYSTPPGIDVKVVPIPYRASDETIAQLVASAVMPEQNERKYMDDIDKAVRGLDIISDRVRSSKDYKSAKTRGVTCVETDLEALENTDMDSYIKRAKQRHTMVNGRTLGKIYQNEL